MDEYYTMRGINFSPRGLKFSLSHNRDISRNDNDQSTCQTSKHRDLGRRKVFGTKDRVCMSSFLFFSDV